MSMMSIYLYYMKEKEIKMVKGEFKHTYSCSVDAALEYRENYTCFMCDLNNGHDLIFIKKEDMLAHLVKHIEAGHVVPIDELRKYRTP